MVNQQDKGKDYYPQAKQGDQEGKPQDYNRKAQQPDAPDHTDTTLKPTKTQPGTYDPTKHNPITSHSKATNKDADSSSASKDTDSVSNGGLAHKTLPSFNTNYYTSSKFLVPLGAGLAGYTGTNMLARSLPPTARLGAAIAGGAFASYFASRYY
eukprot:Phypoly_transcript_22298.p1 GENE.Phypoly_transcript_22298~~Phypoly_transcript_22298.p1  ORF type:complete len:154 (+),score=35.50 Phypoly_transcript_22298:111-572(+)